MFTVFSRNAIYDSTLVLEAFGKHLWNVSLNVLEILLVSDLIKKIWTIETTLEADNILLDTKSLHYIFLNLDSSSSSQS